MLLQLRRRYFMTKMKRGRSLLTSICVSFAISVVAIAQSANSSTLTILHSFAGGTDGAYPEAGLIRDASGNFYGTTQGGTAGDGTVFLVSPEGDETVLFDFAAQSEGSSPCAPLFRDGTGNLYGTTLLGGTDASGTVLKLSESGKETVLFSFNGSTDGSNPRGGLVDLDGSFYGTTLQGGNTSTCNGFGCGTVFKITGDNDETVLHIFTGSPDGANPEKGLIKDEAGNLYGTTFTGGKYNYGTVYEISPAGVENVLYSFAGPPDGAYPWGTLVRDAKGNLYGTTLGGGNSPLCTPGCGTIFALHAGGKDSVLYSFSGTADGDQPYGNLVQDESGNFYGTTFGGGDPVCNGGGGCGTVFEFSAGGSFTTLHSFQGAPEDGANPYDGVVLDPMGNLYGTTFYGGANNFGTVFELTP
jgi:uncharacterized repeat protein (TIGR03803 family)